MVSARFLFVLLVVAFSGSKVSGQISGIVKDGSGNPLPEADVFINKSSISSVSDATGAFSLSGVAPGFSELIVYKKGFQIFRSPIRIQEGHAVKVPIRLSAAPSPEITGEVKNPKDKLIFYNALHALLIGAGDLSHSAISNQDALKFYKSGDTLKVSADPIKLVNPSTGYKITYYREATDVRLSSIMTSMVFRFEAINANDDAQLKEFNDQREKLFFGSQRHLLSSLVRRQSVVQGFTLRNNHAKILHADSLLAPNKVMGYSIIKLKGKTRIEFELDGKQDVRVSSLDASDDFAVNDFGILLNEKSITVEGNMKVSNLAELVPVNYYPEQAIAVRGDVADINKFLQEKIYVQTDKPYYYPGEVMWFKGYVNYFEQTLRDSLSKTAYFELISPAGTIALAKLIKINHGAFYSDLIVPETLTAGNYQLRVYTNLMKNFSEANVFRKAVRILGPTDKVDPASGKQAVAATKGLSITADKPSYKLRDKITLSVRMLDEDMQPLASVVSMSVTDDLQVVPVPENVSIEKNYLFPDESDKPIPKTLQNPVEKGIGFTAQFLNEKGKGQKANVTALEGGFNNMVIIETNQNGMFTESGFDFYDSMAFSFQVLNSKDKAYGKVIVLPKEGIPVMSVDSLPVRILQTSVKQRVISELEVPHDVTTLSEVTVSAKKIEGSKFISNKYGRPQRMFDGTKFKGTDMLNSLTGQIPGLKTFNGSGDMSMQQYLTLEHIGMKNPTSEVLLYVNDSYRAGGVVGQTPSVLTSLMTLNPANLDHVEVFYSSPPNRMISVEGGVGLIALYMKPGGLDQKTFQKIMVPGYVRTRPFVSPDYSKDSGGQKDFRSTIFWEPALVIENTPEPAQVSFFAADLPGQYRVVVEGVTSENKPVRGELYLQIVDH